VSALEVETASDGSTRGLGALLAPLLEPGDVVLLTGGLGAGKTTFVKGVVAGLGCTQAVTSPTFTLVRTYESEPVVAHVDCWRLDQLDEVADLALDEVLDAGGVALVEWGEAAAPLFGAGALEIRIDAAGAGEGKRARGAPAHSALQAERVEASTRDESARVVALSSRSPSWEHRLARLEALCRGAGLAVRDSVARGVGP